MPILSLTLWIPTLGAILLALLPKDNATLHRQVALGISVVAFFVSLLLPLGFQEPLAGGGSMQFVEAFEWVPAWGIGYVVGIDGISLWLIVLTTFLTPLAMLSAWTSITTHVRAFQVLMLLLETAMLGVFMAQDLFLFYVFWEFSLIPMAFIIGIWGGEQRVYAAVKFFLYTFAGSVLMLLAIIALALMADTFNLQSISNGLQNGTIALETEMARWLFGAFFLAFAIKVPLWPFHTWLPDAHVQAPTPGSVILAGVLLKMGTYGLIRFNLLLFPEASRWAAPAIAILAIIGILYGAAVAFAQSDMKKLVAYSSVSHMGFIVLGIFALNIEGISGATLQMINHGLSTGALFMVVGIIYERRHTREIKDYGGLWSAMPIYGGLTLVVVLSSAGLPGLNGFIGEFAIMQGAYISPDLGWRYLLFAVVGVILAAVYLLRMFGGAFMGELRNPDNRHVPDLNQREVIALTLFIIPIIIIGVYPNVVFEQMQGSIAQLLESMSQTVARF
jgi:NADH-quinone oxidoreductase subunit M